ncbi:SRPBCC family protein [Rhizobium sp. RCC_161_2]|uniref:SRPBCC family protein n=1 Tax=Rhizobium sp. RCC_161_2 TaxID=3239219 RepID=UPI0035238924
MNSDASWSKFYSCDVDASQQAIWQAFADAGSWKLWNPGVKSAQLDGNFATGTWFSMELPDGEIIRSRLIDVSAPQRFIDETLVGETLIQVEHSIEAVAHDQCRVVYAVNSQGPDAQAIGEAVSADFPDVLARLAKYVA